MKTSARLWHCLKPPMGKHAVLSASGASRWLACTPSARLEQAFPNTSSSYAQEGTVAHELAEMLITYKLGRLPMRDFNEGYARIKTGPYFNAEMQEYVNAYADYVFGRYEEAQQRAEDALIELEARLDFSRWVPEGFGTGDCIIIADGTMEVIDLKYGKGLRVEAEKNSQMRLYALGALDEYGMLYDIENVLCTIYQPRLIDGISIAETTANALFTWGDDYVAPRAAMAFEGEGEFAPSGEACRWCRAGSACKARINQTLELFDEAPNPELATLDEIGAFLQKAENLQNLANAMRERVNAELLAGKSCTGWKLVEGRSNRRYADKDAVGTALTEAGFPPEDIYKTELLSLTALEKAFGKKAIGECLEGLIEKPKGAPTLAPESDKRPAFIPSEEVLKAFDAS